MYRLGSIVPLLLGVFGLCYSYFLLPLGRLTNPGPGLWPFIVSAFIVLASLILLVTDRDREDYERFTARTRYVGLGIVSIGLFIVLFKQIGFIIPGFLTLVFWLRFLGKESWRMTLIVSVLVTIGFYLLFVTLLGIPLPEDILV